MTPNPIEELRSRGEIAALVDEAMETARRKISEAYGAAYDAKCAEVEAERKQHKIDNEGNQEWINSLCEQLCKMEDALGFKNDAYDKKGKWVPTIGPWMERLRDLLAAEGEVGDLKEELREAEALLKDSQYLVMELAAFHWEQRRNAWLQNTPPTNEPTGEVNGSL